MKIFLFYFLSVLSLQQGKQSQLAVATKLKESKHYTECITICTTEIKKLKPSNKLFTEYLALRADACAAMGDFSNAFSDTQTLIKIHPLEARYYANASFFLGEKGEVDNALAILKDGMKVNPKNMIILNNLSYYSNQLLKYDEGLMYANMGLALAKDAQDKAFLINNRGFAYIGLEKYDLALNDVNEAIRINPDNSFAYCYRALANIHLNNLETVCADLAKSKNLGAEVLTADLIKQYCKN